MATYPVPTISGPNPFDGQTDDELRSQRDAILAELERRRVLADAEQRVDDINRQVLDAKGETDGGDWVQPTGASDAYPTDWTVQHNGKKWISLTPANVWEPGTSSWREVVPEGSTGPAEWVQPTGSTDAYKLGSQVSHNGSVWQTTVDNNVWEPGVYGWDPVSL
jgi:hypothetical protein